MSLQSRETRVEIWGKRILLGVVGLALLVAVLATAFYFAVRGSLPVLDGQTTLTKLSRPATIARDANGSVAITAETATDAIRTLGFVHAQERYFEMDLARRSAAGELSALLGKATVEMDKRKRPHRLRAHAVSEWASAASTEREWLQAYTEGVNAGLESLAIRPWQYLVLRATPEPWRPEDSLLVIAEMYTMLQQGGFESRFSDVRLRALLGERLFDWMRPQGGPWDATLDGITPRFPSLPSAEEIDTRATSGIAPAAPAKSAALFAPALLDHELTPGSNNWAVAGTRTADGRAILANDMHLGLSTPGIWFRVQLTFNALDTSAKRLTVAGVTLPGVPQVAVGSNGHIAWGFTNNYGQYFDWLALPKAQDRTLEVKLVNETIVVRGAEAVTLAVKTTRVGPILKSDAQNDYALSWALYQPGSLMNRVDTMMTITELDTALAAAHQTPMPHQNLVIADKHGSIAWTVIGRVPERPQWQISRGALAAPDQLAAGWLDGSKVPLIKNPPEGILWTANSRQLGGEGQSIIGDGGFDLGARAMQIRDRLREQDKHSEQTLYAIQLDNESRFLKRWAALAIERAAAPGANEKVKAMGAALKRWNGKADIDQVGHLAARSFREGTLRTLWKAWLSTKDPTQSSTVSPDTSDATLSHDARFEYAAWQAIEARAPHLLPPKAKSWESLLDDELAFSYDVLVKAYGSLDQATWGQRNMSKIKHPFSRAMPFLAPYLDMSSRPLAGDNHMPLVAAPTFGASQRLVVSPGKESDAILTVAGGQSGHPLSPFYGGGHQAWLTGEKLPLLAGKSMHTLRLSP